MTNVLEMLEDTSARYGEKMVFADSTSQFTYAEVVETAQRIGSCLASKEVYGRAIVVFVPKSVEMLISFFGVIYSGNFYVPIDSKMPVDRILLILDTLAPYKIIVDRHTESIELGKYNGLKIQYEVLTSGQRNIDKLRVIRTRSIDTDPVYALFTSGSTGLPKGVIVPHRAVLTYAKWCVDTFHFNETTVFGNQTPFYFSMSVLDIYATICSGASLYIIPKVLFTFPVNLMEFMNVNKINTIYWVPSALCQITKFNMFSAMKLPYLKNILFAGEVMPTKHLNLWRKSIPNAVYANLFGPTEITDIGVYYIIDREFEDDQPIPIGHPCRNIDVFVLDEQYRLVTEPGIVGELYYRGSYLAHGYYNNWDKTDEAYVQNPLNSAYPEPVYRSGDLVQWNEYGELVYVCRKDFQIKHMGYRIELGEIENAANSCAGVDRSVAVYEECADNIYLFYEGNKDMEDVNVYIKNKLPEYMLPYRIYKLRQLPLNENGKTDRKQLLEMVRGKVG